MKRNAKFICEYFSTKCSNAANYNGKSDMIYKQRIKPRLIDPSILYKINVAHG